MEYGMDKIYYNYLLAVDMIFGLWCGFVFHKEKGN